MALFGLFLLTLILFLFVGLRNALITGLGIPVSFAITLIVLELSGQTINTNTLFGLVLVLGLIVDHGIVIVENSYRPAAAGLYAAAGGDERGQPGRGARCSRPRERPLPLFCP